MLPQFIFLQDRLAKAKAEDKKLVLSVQKEERRRRVDKVMKRMKKRKCFTFFPSEFVVFLVFFSSDITNATVPNKYL